MGDVLKYLEVLFGAIGEVVWGPFLLIPLLLGTGVVLTIRLGFLQFHKLGPALHLGILWRRDTDAEGGDVSQFQALTTALAATVGVGNIVGVAGAISLGGPGALFWMWVTGLLGMASKYSEAFLGVRFRTTDAAGEISAKSLDQAVQTLGGNGLSTEYGLARMFGASRLPRIAPISREMLLNYVGTNIMGLPKSY